MQVTAIAKTRLLVVDDQLTVREILRSNLDEEEDLEVVGVAADGEEALAAIESLRPDVALIDIEMPNVDGLSATRAIVERFPATKVLVLSSHDDDEYLNRALEVGASGYVLKAADTSELVETIRSIHRGYFQFGSDLLRKVLQPVSDQDLPNCDADRLEEFGRARGRSGRSGRASAGKERLLLEKLYRNYTQLQEEQRELRLRYSTLAQRLGKLDKQVVRNRGLMKVLVVLLVLLSFAAFLYAPGEIDTQTLPGYGATGNRPQTWR